MENEDRIINELTNDCAKDVFEELIIASFDMPYIPIIENSQIPEITLSDEIISLFLNSEFTGYKIQNGGIQGTNPPAARTTTERGMVITTMNDNYLSNATDLSIVRTMIHELVHAYILHESSSTNFDFRESIREYAKKYGYNPYGSPEEKMRFHHEFMGQFVLGMAGSLKYWNEHFGNGNTSNIDDNYYISMAFGGLFYDLNGVQTPTDSFIAMIPDKTERDKIIEILKNEQDGKSNSYGKKCSY